MVRPFSTRAWLRLILAGGILYGGGAAAVGFVLLTSPEIFRHPAASTVVAVFTGLCALGLFALPLLVSPLTLRRSAPVLGVVANLLSTLIVTAGIASAGPDFGSLVAAAYIEAPLFAMYMLRRRWAVLIAVLALVGFALVLAVQDGWEAPLGRWVFLLASVGATSVLMGVIAERADRLAESEHALAVELAGMNHTLEERVDAQVREIERLGGLRRFLSPQVADAVLSGDAEAIMRPHRRRIAVFFCDLRGFTAFTNSTEPEEVVDVLDEYYGAVGGLLQTYDATVGGYAGDGIMAYFGDPVPHEDPAQAAVEMTVELRQGMGAAVENWQRRGYDLNYGVGLTFGYATLGVIGFDGRYDYTPLGGVVNLAARLCAHAGPGQVLLDHSTHAATTSQFPSEHHADLDLKGYPVLTKVYTLADLRPEARSATL
ncbi:adenylate/guanylate cyclase domain-containing protein [Nocardioides antri]|nr:adenylate/guanylate cyclase domain-containing protein [Nocardioides antri]